jgi:outer membrane protein TolC
VKKSRKCLSVGLSVVLSLLVLAVTAVAAETPATLTVTKAVELALQQNIGVKLAELTFDNAKIAYDKTMASNPTSVVAKQAEITWEKAQVTYNQTKIDVITNTLNSYVGLQNALLDLTIKEKQAAAAQRALERTQILVQKGSAGTLDELQAQLGQMSAANALDRARDSYAESAAGFANWLGLESLPQLSTENVLLIPEIDITLDEALKTAFAKSITIKEREIAFELASIQRAQEELLELAPVDERMSQNNFVMAELTLAKAKSDFEESVIVAYNGLVSSRKAVKVAVSSFELEQQRFDIVKKQFDSGLKTATDLDSAEVSLLNAQLNLRSAQRAYVAAWLSFQKLLGNEIDLTGVVKPDASE